MAKELVLFYSSCMMSRDLDEGDYHRMLLGYEDGTVNTKLIDGTGCRYNDFHTWIEKEGEKNIDTLMGTVEKLYAAMRDILILPNTLDQGSTSYTVELNFEGQHLKVEWSEPPGDDRINDIKDTLDKLFDDVPPEKPVQRRACV